MPPDEPPAPRESPGPRLWVERAKTALRTVALAAPAFLFYLIWYADEHRKPLRTTPVFLAVAALALAFGRRVAGRGERADGQAAGGKSNGPADERTSGRAGGFWSHAWRFVRGDGLWARGADRWGLRLAALVGLGLLWILFTHPRYQEMAIYPLRAHGLWTAVGFAAAMLCVVVVRPPRPWLTLGLLVGAELLVRLWGFRQWSIEPVIGDMLPLVRNAIDHLLSGLDPYAVHQMQLGSLVPLTYPPGLWLAYLPARAVGLDIRWISWLADIVVAGALAWPALRAATRAPRDGRPAPLVPPATWPVLLAVAAYLFLPDTHWNGIYAEPQVDWAVTALLACAIATRRPLAIGLLLGLALAMRPLNLPLAPVIAVGLWRLFGLRRAAQALLAGAAVTVAFYLPFVLWNPDTFFLGTVRWLFEYSRVNQDWFYGMMGFTGPLTQAHHAAWLHPLQLAAMAMITFVAAWRVRTPRGLLAACAAVYALTVTFNPLIWMSFWIGAVIWIAATVSCPTAPSAAAAPAPAAAPHRTGRRAFFDRTPVLVGGGVLALALGGWMAFLLARHFSTDGRTELRRALLSRVRPGDEILDRTGFRFALLAPHWILVPPALPAGVFVAGDPFSIELPERRAVQPGPIVRIFAVDRYGLFDADRAAFDGIYRIAAVEHFGRYRLTTLERSVAGRARRFVDALRDLRVSVQDARRTEAARWSETPPQWTFGDMPPWVEVKRQQCFFNDVPAPMLWAHPPPAGFLVVGMAVPAEARWALVSGGLNDGAPEWGLASVTVDVWAGGTAPLGRLRIPNAPGRVGRVVELPPGHGPVLDLSVGTVDPARRHVCIDATVW